MKSQYLTTEQMQTLERHAVEKYSISLEQMMQKAGRAVFTVAMEALAPSRVLVVVGKGNNGGDALVAARLLSEKGIEVSIFSIYPDEELSPLSKKEIGKIRKKSIPIIRRPDFLIGPNGNDGYDLIIDGIFGFSLKGNPRLPEAQIIEQILYSKIPVLSVDVPSCLDTHDGSVGKPAIKADYTVALGMLKKGFGEHPEYIGKLFLGDLGIPENAYRDKKYDPPLFRGKSYLSVN